MYPVLLEFEGFTLYSYGVLIVLAVLAGGFAAARLFKRLGHQPWLAFDFAVAAALGGFLGARVYWLAEQRGQIDGDLLHHLVLGAGFTWYGGLLGGAAAVIGLSLYRRLPLGLVANVLAPAVALGYAVGRVACQLAGDGTYGRPSDLPWAMAYPQGTVPTFVAVHPTPVYETAAMLLVFALLWRMTREPKPGWHVFGWFLVLSGAERFAVEFLRNNDVVAMSLTAPQLFALAGIVLGTALLLRPSRPVRWPPRRLPLKGDMPA